jgi:hypothetical protein
MKILDVLIAMSLVLLACLPVMFFLAACNNPRVKDPHNYCVGIRKFDN